MIIYIIFVIYYKYIKQIVTFNVVNLIYRPIVLHKIVQLSPDKPRGCNRGNRVNILEHSDYDTC